MEKSQRIINSGTASLMMIFTVLALVTFALLSCSSAGAQWRLACKMAERTSRYYEAERQAAVWLEEQILKLPQQEKMLSREFPVEENQHLEVRVQVAQQEGEVGWKLESWQLKETEKEPKEQTMQLYQKNGKEPSVGG